MDITRKWTGRRQDWSMIHAQMQKSPSQPHLHAVLAPPCRSFSPTFTH